MIYLLYGLDEYLIKKEIDNIITKHNINRDNIIKYDLNNINIKDVVEDALMISMFDDDKFIICDNSNIFTTKESEVEHNTSYLEEYINHVNENTIIVFKIVTEKLDERRKIVKELKNKFVVKEIKLNNIFLLVKEMFIEYQINDNTIRLFIERVGNNLLLLENEANKLKMYKYEEKDITEEDIKELISINYDLDIFKFIDDIVNRKKDKAFTVYKEMLKNGEEPVKLIVILANQFRLMLQVKILTKEGLSESEIARNLMVHPYRVKLAKEKSYNYSNDTLTFFLKELGELDYKIKNSQIDKDFALELFIMEV
jgi:DNA polymerase III subunit delta